MRPKKGLIHMRVIHSGRNILALIFSNFQEASFLGTSRCMSVLNNQADSAIADLASKLDQVLESQSKMRDQIREDVQAEFKDMNSKIERIKHTQENKDRAKYKKDVAKLEAENKLLMEKSDTLKKHYASLKEQLREKNETVNNLIKENKSLKSKLSQTDKRQLHTQNENKIKQLQKGNDKRKRCAAQKSGTSLYNLSSKLREHGRHAMLSFLSSPPSRSYAFWILRLIGFMIGITKCMRLHF